MDSDHLSDEESKEIIGTIEDIVDYYDKMNNLVTFHRAEKWRRTAAAFSDDRFDVLEIGCGPGSFAKHLRGKRIVCVDPSEKLMAVAEKRIGLKAEFRVGKAENLPVDSATFDRVFCSFSFRDFKDKELGLRESFRVLRKGGMLVILEIAKPKGAVRRRLMNLHLKYDVPLLARFVVPSKVLRARGRNVYDELWATYQKYNPVEDYAALMRKIGYIDIEWKELTFGGAVLLRGRKA